MTRRRSTRWLVAVAAAAVTLTSCATFSSDVARVGDAGLGADHFQELLAGVAATPGFESFMLGDNSMDAEFARGLLNRWITGQVLLNDLTARGLTISDTVRSEVDQDLAATNGPLWLDAPQELRDLFIDSISAVRAFGEANRPDPATLRATYEAGISASAVACTRHILVETEAEAVEVVNELRAGADFATLAGERSTDAGSAVNGGIIEPAPGAGCFDLASFSQGLVPEFVTGALSATVGVPTEPIRSEFGWHVIVVRPFDEVADVVADLGGGANLDAAVDELLTAADITVASRYGRFDVDQGIVVARGS